MASRDSYREKETLLSDDSRREEATGVLSQIRRGVASLVGRDTEPDPRGFSRSGTQLYSADADITRPEDDIEKYYEEYKNNSIIETQIDNLALEVFEPGYWVTADSDETETEIEEFLKNVGIVGSKTHVPFDQFGQFMLRQHEVRGTFEAEKVTDDDGRHLALNPLNPSTMEIYTKPGTNVLLPPDYDADENATISVKDTPGGEVAAFVQFDTQFSRWEHRNELRFTKDQVIHWPRNPDIGEQFGHSRIEPVLERSRALREKMQDNDLAIAMKAWPMVLFQLGSEDRPWTRDEMEEFMANYQEQNLGPGMYQGVPGDVEVEEFAGETADISEHVTSDVDMIVSGMPGPKHTLGSFASGDENAALAGAYERQFRKIVRAKRREIEGIMTPYLKEVAESWGYDPSGLELRIGRPEGEVAPEDVQGSIIRYESDAGSGDESGETVDIDDIEPGDTVNGKTVIGDSETTTIQEIREEREEDADGSGGSENGPTGPSVSTGVASADDPQLHQLATESLQELGTTDTETATESLSNDGVRVRDIEADVGDVLAPIVSDVLEDTLSVIETRHTGRRDVNPKAVADEFSAQLGSQLRGRDVERTIERGLRNARERTADKLNEELDTDAIVGLSRTATDSLLRKHREMILNDFQSFGDEIGDAIRHSLTDIEASDDMSVVRSRVESLYSDAEMSRRTRLFVRMALIGFVNKIKYTAYERDDAVVGVRVSNTCTEDTPEIVRDLAGCAGGEAATARFDADKRVGAQLMEQASADPHNGFTPLPDTPPFHFNDTTQYKPVFADND